MAEIKLKRELLADLVERCSTFHLFVTYIAAIFIFGFGYALLGNIGNGIVATFDESKAIKLFEYFYFSVVTMTSLGYGDYRPIGYSRSLAIFQAILGLALLGLLIAKLSSIRQSNLISYLFLVNQKETLNSFSYGIRDAVGNLSDSAEKNDEDQIRKNLDSIYGQLNGLYRYLVLITKHGYLDTDPENYVFKRVINTLTSVPELESTTMGMLSHRYPAQKGIIKRNLHVLKEIQRKFVKYDSSIDVSSLREQINKQRAMLSATSELYASEIKNVTGKSTSELIKDEEFINAVKNQIPPGQRERGLHRIIAKELGAPPSAVFKILKIIDSDDIDEDK